MKPAQNALSSHPATNTTSAPPARTASARSAQSAKNGSSSSGVRSTGNGANHTSRPASAAHCAARLSRSGSPPDIRTASQCSSPAIAARSWRTASTVKVLRESSSPGRKPVS
ncbi:hypothetical protein ACFXPQ_32790 [Streptomyces lydicus]|uniref:hypothetical protein n=1 Tax=Streptomyces lydicus TaxID=47763 RepID=UPI0036B401F1